MTWDDMEADAYSKADELGPDKAEQVRKLGKKAFDAARASGKNPPKEDSVTRRIRKASGK